MSGEVRKVLVTGSSGHLGEALVRTLREQDYEVVGLDVAAGPCTDVVGSVADRPLVRQVMEGAHAVLHSAALHKPHVATHSRQAFVDTNITGTLNLLEEAVAAGVQSFVFTSTTSLFGDALVPPADQPAAWVTEEVVPVPKNIYGVTKAAAEDLCQLFHRNQKLPCIVLRTSRFFREADDDEDKRQAYDDDNLKASEFLCRRVDIEDAANAHVLAMHKAPEIGFGRYIISATSPFLPEDLAELRRDAPAVVRRRVPDYEDVYQARGWIMMPSIDRVYVNERARVELGWTPRHDFRAVVARLRSGGGVWSPLGLQIGSKSYHAQTFDEGPYPVSG